MVNSNSKLIKEIRDIRVPLRSQISNSIINFAEHDVSLVAVISNVVKHGKPVIGLAFNSIGRFAQSGILRDRIIPRIISAPPETLINDYGFDCESILRTSMCNEKPGGHGDRASAIAAIELAFWDLNAKLRDEPAYVTIARHFDRIPSSKISVYAAGGYYYGDSCYKLLRDEIKDYINQGFEYFKIKIGGTTLNQDLKRIEAALEVCGEGTKLAVDANGRFNFDTALKYANGIEQFGLRWLEEVGDPLDFDLNMRISEHYPGPLATGENLFSTQDVTNLLSYGGMKPNRDIFQMDAGLSYGLIEFNKIISILEKNGFSRNFVYPHGGHLINVHITSGMNLGGCEAYPNIFQPVGGYIPECPVIDGYITPPDYPGFGLEAKNELKPFIEKLCP